MRWKGFWIIALIAFAVRLAYLAQIRGTPLTDVLLIDAETYDRFARRILAGTYRGEDVYSMNPLYPYFLAGVYALTGGATFAALIVQAALGALNAALVFAIGQRLLGTGPAWVAGLMAACYAPYVFFTGALLTPTLVDTCVLTALLALSVWRIQPSARLLVAAGSAIGLAALLRGNAILFVALTPIYFRLETKAWARAWGPWVVFAIAALVPPALVTVRNMTIEGRLVPISANYAALYIGHFKNATGLYSPPEFAATGSFQDEVVGVREALSRELGRPLTQADASRELLARALAWARAHPREELALAARKLRYFWNGVEAHTNLSFYVAKDFSSLLHALPLGFGIVAPLGLAGMVAERRRWREHLLLHLAVMVPLVTCVVFFVSAEYRLPAVAPLLLFAANAVVGSAAWVSALLRPAPAKTTRRSRSQQAANSTGPAAIPATAWLALGLTPILAWATNATPRPLRMQANNRAAYQNYVMAYASRGEPDRAALMLRRVMAADPAAGEADLGQVRAEQLIQAGRYEDALQELRRVHARYLELGRREEAKVTASSIAFTLHRLGRESEAERMLIEIVASDPAFVDAHIILGLVYEAEGRVAEATTEYRRALALAPGEPRAREALERLTGRRIER